MGLGRCEPRLDLRAPGRRRPRGRGSGGRRRSPRGRRQSDQSDRFRSRKPKPAGTCHAPAATRRTSGRRHRVQGLGARHRRKRLADFTALPRGAWAVAECPRDERRARRHPRRRPRQSAVPADPAAVASPRCPSPGKYRLIDIPVSNCLNSNLRRIFVLTQYNSESLNKHLSSTYKFDVFSNALRLRAGRGADGGEPRLVPGHGRRGAPEPALPARPPLPRRPHPLRRPALPDGLPEDARDPPAPRRPTSRWR